MLGTVDGLKKFITIQESPYHGLNFCQGTVSEMLQNPSAEIYDVIRYFGSATRSSMSISATSAAIATILWRCIPMRGTLTS